MGLHVGLRGTCARIFAQHPPAHLAEPVELAREARSAARFARRCRASRPRFRRSKLAFAASASCVEARWAGACPDDRGEHLRLSRPRPGAIPAGPPRNSIPPRGRRSCISRTGRYRRPCSCDRPERCRSTFGNTPSRPPRRIRKRPRSDLHDRTRQPCAWATTAWPASCTSATGRGSEGARTMSSSTSCEALAIAKSYLRRHMLHGAVPTVGGAICRRCETANRQR